jgi:hypothetical protein
MVRGFLCLASRQRSRSLIKVKAALRTLINLMFLPRGVAHQVRMAYHPRQ